MLGEDAKAFVPLRGLFHTHRAKTMPSTSIRLAQILLALLLLAPLGGCMDSGTSKYPSLLPRPIESQSLAEPERPTPVVEADPALDAKVNAITATLDKAEKEFNVAAQNAEAAVAVARGLPEGSSPWLDAQTALSEAESKREPVSTALSDLAQLEIDRGVEGKQPYPAIAAATARAAEIAKAQTARIKTLDGALKTP
jgi:hypothetical protein